MSEALHFKGLIFKLPKYFSSPNFMLNVEVFAVILSRAFISTVITPLSNFLLSSYFTFCNICWSALSSSTNSSISSYVDGKSFKSSILIFDIVSLKDWFKLKKKQIV